MACAHSESQGQPGTALPTVIATDLDVPWGIAFLPDGSALVAERSTGAIKHMTAPDQLSPVGNVDGVVARPEGGLLGLATGGPDVFAYLTTGQDNRVVRTGFDGAALTAQTPILTGIPVAAIHNGGRIAFGPDGKLYVATGEASEPQLAQDRSSLGGKILRINPDGSVPPDNPFPGSPIWSLGHRNVQGLAWDSTGRMWATEYGANRLDELNLVKPGGNYGWPMAEGRAGIEGLTDPMLQWPVEAASPSGLAFYGGALWVAALRGQRLFRVPVGADGMLGEAESLFVGRYGRLRTVVAAPDGSLWFTTSNRDGRGNPREGDDKILRYRP
ncbi:PQQ-dependent sugar dehydrogenase [Mycobacterium sp. IDR2000157661]|uniref:PQQ-dependent sugar dehydrogenase n=1 Tax=Mycobacterium sp. IDR2000157661 TaxID=2867005 RepID=UPI001EEB93BA|nr:PQQ-dependent sugar dehydrogenase [Mycobacterium sp. IDR2000157661]ULE34097.1 PQQ-dependent sugar dehydrogenase [Mycobacterium sp. IDR2000157661]